MKKRYSLSILFFPLVIFLFSCSKDNDPGNGGGGGQTKTQMLTSGTWRFDKATSGGIDISSVISTCYKDNTMTFSATGGTGVFDEGLTKCNSGDPQTINFTWSFTSSETVLNVNGAIFAGQSGSFTILTLTSTQLVLQGTFNTTGGSVTGEIYFKH